MRHRCCSVRLPIPACVSLAIAALLTVAVPRAHADPADWSTVDYTLFSAMQAVDSSGAGTWTVPLVGSDQAYRLRGVVLNNPEDMLDGTPNYLEGPMWAMGGQWQVYIQWIDNPAITYDDDDFGGAALWLGQNYGNHYWHYPDWSYNYSDAEWLTEVERVDPGGALQAGDLIEVHARGGLFHAGKFNVNEQHDNEVNDFDIIVLDYVGLPTVAEISLEGIKNPDNTFKFSDDRTLLDNPEHYQATLVELLGVELVDATGWGNDAELLLRDADSPDLTIALKLGLNGFDGVTAPTGVFDVVGIFDQEGSSDSGYRLWVMDAGQFSGSAQGVPEPAGFVLAAMGLGLLAAFGRRRRWPAWRA